MRSSEWRWPTFSSNALLSLRRAHSRCLPVGRSEFIRSVRPQVQPVSKPVPDLCHQKERRPNFIDRGKLHHAQAVGRMRPVRASPSGSGR